MNTPRIGQKQRTTRETTISAQVNIDGTGVYDVHTGVGFFDHMIEQLSRHSLIDITLRGEGDRHIDDHHLVEDCGIVLGSALAQAMGDCKGIVRYANALIPMDETLVEVALDISKRPFLHFNLPMPHSTIGNFATELLPEFFRAFAFAAGLTLHVNLRYGANGHHIAEAAFKATARALRAGLSIDPRASAMLPSTKDHLGE